jgi:hypothetical protein
VNLELRGRRRIDAGRKFEVNRRACLCDGQEHAFVTADFEDADGSGSDAKG